jgi:hypothetical protein
LLDVLSTCASRDATNLKLQRTSRRGPASPRDRESRKREIRIASAKGEHFVRANIRNFLEEVGRESEKFGHTMRVCAVIIVHRTKLCAQLNRLGEAAQKHGCIFLDAAMHLEHRNRKMTVPLNNV